jgi:purine-binding chemotaxis protein CheW
VRSLAQRPAERILRMDTIRQFCTFRLDSHLFGLDVLDVQEIIRQQSVTRIPLAPPMVRGLINLRGQIITVIDLRLRLGLAERAADRPAVNVVVRCAGSSTSLMVDEIGDMMSFPDAGREGPPETLRGAIRDLITGVYKLDGQLLLVLDTVRTIDIAATVSAA